MRRANDRVLWRRNTFAPWVVYFRSSADGASAIEIYLVAYVLVFFGIVEDIDLVVTHNDISVLVTDSLYDLLL